MRERHAGHKPVPGVVGADHCRAHVPVDRQHAFSAVEVRLRAPAPDRQHPAGLRAPVEREARPGQQVRVSEAHADPAVPVLASGHRSHRCLARPVRSRCHRARAPVRRRRAGCTGVAARAAVHRRACSHRPVGVVAADPPQESEREVPAHVAVDVPAGELAVEPGLARGVDALLDLVDDVRGGRAAEVRDERARHRVVVVDRAGRCCVVQYCAGGGVRQRQRQRLVVVVRVIQESARQSTPPWSSQESSAFRSSPCSLRRRARSRRTWRNRR